MAKRLGSSSSRTRSRAGATELCSRPMAQAFHKLTVSADKLLGRAARALWPLFEAYGDRFPEAPLEPKWAPAPLARKKDRTFPPLGWPRKTDSLCPTCVKEARTAVLSGELDLAEFTRAHPGEIPAEIVESDGRVVMRKTCARARRVRRRDQHRSRIPRAHRAAVSRARLRGAADAAAPARHILGEVRARRRAHGGPHESLQHDVRSVLHGRKPGRLRARARPGKTSRRSWTTPSAVKPRRQLSVQFSGGEPTLSPAFPRSHPLRAAGRLLLRAVRVERHPLRARRRSSAGRRRPRGSGSVTCSSTASATRRTRTARSATSST